MKADVFEARMRALEEYHSLRVPAGAFPIIRVDGRSFSRFTRDRFEKPFDRRFHELMVATAMALLTETAGIYAYTESDEISLLLPHTTDYFGREVEKLVSITASVASVAFSMACGDAAVFDGRVCVAPDVEAVVDYFRWRQEDARRCAINGSCYWMLRRHGQSEAEATAALHGRSHRWKLDLLAQRGGNFVAQPAWQRLGSGVFGDERETTGFNPLRGEAEVAVRRELIVNEELPRRDDYANWLRALIGKEDVG